jgi:glycosyltransferase involved in cell wall biosynthesis
MDFQWMNDITFLKRIKDAISFRHRVGDLLSWAPKLGLAPKPGGRKPGISALMRLKNESRFIEAAIRSLAPFVEQFSIVDNGSTDGTPEIIERVALELSLDYTLDLFPNEDFGEVCDRALRNTTCQWVLRWDGDMIARTDGPESFARIREFALSLDPARYYVVYFPHIRLEGDLFHQDPDFLLHDEDWLFTFSPELRHQRVGRYREVLYPLSYKRVSCRMLSSFHIASLDPPEALIMRRYWTDWRHLNDFAAYPTLRSYVEERIKVDYGTDSLTEAGALFIRERFAGFVPYDRERFGDYPAFLKPFLDSLPALLVERDGRRPGRIVGRSDVMEVLDRLDRERRQTPAEVIIPTRNREEYALATVKHLLAQDYPRFRIIVVDQSDQPSEALRSLSLQDSRLVHHAAESRGLPAGRNEGLRLSSGEIVIFVDDDVVPEPGFIEGHVFAYRDRSLGAAAGRVHEGGGRRSVEQSGKTGRINRWTGEIHQGFTVGNPVDVDTALGANMSFLRSAIAGAGGFDERFGGTALYEETDACLTLKEKGYRIRYCPDVAITHLHAGIGGCRLSDPRREIYWYMHNFLLLFLKHFPRRGFPVWFAVRCAKAVCDAARYRSVYPLVWGFKGLKDGYFAFRIRREAPDFALQKPGCQDITD